MYVEITEFIQRKYNWEAIKHKKILMILNLGTYDLKLESAE